MQVLLDIKNPLLRSYLQHLFENAASESNLDILKVTKRNLFGSLLCSLVKYSTKKVNHMVTDQTVYFQLPVDNSLKNAGNYHLYYLKEDVLKINDLLDTIFNIDFDRYYLDGLQQGFQRKEIVSTFIVVRNLSGLEDVAGSLKKRKYRQESKLHDERIKILTNRAYERHHRIKPFDRNKVVKSREKVI